MSGLMAILKRRPSADVKESSFASYCHGNGNRTSRRCASMRKEGDVLSPLMEGPVMGGDDDAKDRVHWWRRGGATAGHLQQLQQGSPSSWPLWIKVQRRHRHGHHQSLLGKSNSMSRIAAAARHFSPKPSSSDGHHLRLLFSVFCCPLSPVPIPSHQPIPRLSFGNSIPTETSSAQYIIQHYLCATGAAKVSEARNMYAMGRVKMAVTEFEAAAGGMGCSTAAASQISSSGCFVLWQMNAANGKDMWVLEMALGSGIKALSGSDGDLVWRHTPWFGSHAAKGPVRPLRRSLQGLDPRAIAALFVTARCVGEKTVEGEECFVLKATADRRTLQSRSDAEPDRVGAAEILRHTIHGYFSQKTGLLIRLDDSQLSKVELAGGAVFWETALESHLDEYRPVDGVGICHAGRTYATLLRFGGGMSGGDWTTTTRLQEEWGVDEVAFDVRGVSPDLFIPPAEICVAGGSGSAKIRGAVGGNKREGNVIWRVEV